MKHIKLLLKFIDDIIISRQILTQLIKRDFQSRYMGSALGMIWAFIQPAVTIGVLWFVFEMGFKARPIDGNFPFILWLSTGMIPWFFISEVLGSATNAVIEHSYLVKKISFRVGLLPIVKIASAAIVHLFLVFLIFILFLLYGYTPSFYFLQSLYYFVCCVVLLTGVTWMTSSIVIFFKDTSQIIQVVIQMGFWGTPIFWSVTNLSHKWQWVFKLNPAYYITEGYRYSFIYKTGFWVHWQWGLYFWGITTIVFALGAVIFMKLKRHFADVI